MKTQALAACGITAALLCGAASAQSSVTAFGVLDLSVLHARGGGVSATTLSSSGLGASRLGFRGTQALGGGFKAGFWLESGLNPDTGAGQLTNTNNQPNGFAGGSGLTFNRRSYASLSGPFGQLRLGRDFVPTHYNIIEFDPFNANGVARVAAFTFSAVGTGSLPTTVAASNSISYWLPPHLGGLHGMAMIASGENPANTATAGAGHMVSARLGWRSGAFEIAAALGRTRHASTATIGNYTHGNLGAAWDLGVARLFALYNLSTVGIAGGDAKKHTLEVGAHIPVGHAGRLRLSHARLDDRSSASLVNANGSSSQRNSNDASLWGVGYVHNLSQRTALYGSYARIANQGQAAYLVTGGIGPGPARPSSALELGMRHAF